MDSFISGFKNKSAGNFFQQFSHFLRNPDMPEKIKNRCNLLAENRSVKYLPFFTKLN
jgi:hypothetical protein